MDPFTIPKKIESQKGYYVRLIPAETTDEVNTYDQPIEFRFEYVFEEQTEGFATAGLKTTNNFTRLIRTSDNTLPFKIDDVILIPGLLMRCKLSGFTNFAGGGWKISSVSSEYLEDRIIAQWPFDTLAIKEQNSKKLIRL